MSKPKMVAPGSIWMELVLWLVFFPAGLVYSVWRMTNKRPAQ